MSLFARARRDFTGITAADLIPPRTSRQVGSVTVTNDTAMRHSAVWACLRLRANLISTLPLDVFRLVDGIQVEMTKPPVLVNPGGERIGLLEWLYSSQVDLDRTGNSIGLITDRNSAGLPSQIDLACAADCSVVQRKDGTLKYRIYGREYDPEQVWHEKQYTISGLPVGLSPIAYAAWTIGQYQSAQQFALDWYSNGGVPQGSLRNTMIAEITPDVAELAKARFKQAINGHDIFVSGKDWEYKPVQAEAVGQDWLEAQRFSVEDIARFFDVPGDLIDASVSSNNITYASITQRNLQFLIMHLGPAIVRREEALTQLLPRPRFVKLNTSALLRMDDDTRSRVMEKLILARVLTPNEARALENRQPLTDAQIDEFTELFGDPNQVTSGFGASPAGGSAPKPAPTNGGSDA